MRINPDGITREGSLRHAKMIAAYWEKRGLHVVPRVEEVASGKTHNMGIVWGVRSDMLNGMPQRKR